jgi:hypothetical protein
MMLQKPRSLTVAIAIAALLSSISGMDGPMAATPAPSPSPTTATAVNEQEKAFAELLTGAVLEGTWQTAQFEEAKEDDKESEKGPKLAEPRTDRYTIEKAEKLGGDHWLITARVQYADKDVSLPVPVRVLWAGDTPVITLDTMNLPMLGKYSARVMFHKGFYSGVWYGAAYGGVMSGRIARAEDHSNDRP